MDSLSDLLTLMRPTGYGFRGLDAGGAWALSFAATRGIRCFAVEGVSMDRIIAALPPIVHAQSSTTRTALYASAQQLMRELSEPRPGSALRAHLEEGRTGQGWLSALAEPRLNRALNAMHADVARRWTLPALADVAGMSRASFAAHFERVIGETPIAYLTRWRMVLAADRMATSGMTITDVAASVGCESDSACGATFKRIMGYSPGRHRQQASAAPV